MGVDPLQPRQTRGMGQQVVVNSHLDLAANPEVDFQEHVQRVADYALCRIFDGDHAEIRLGALHLFEYGFDRRVPERLYGMAEMPVHRLLGERAFRAEVGYFQRLLAGQAGGHDLPEQAQNLRVAERAFVPLEHRAQYLRLPLRAVIVHGVRQCTLGLADCVRQRRPFIDQALDCLVERVDLRPYRIQVRLSGVCVLAHLFQLLSLWSFRSRT